MRFIELTMTEDGSKLLVNLSQVDIISGDAAGCHLLLHDDSSVEVKENYEKLKQLVGQ